MQQDVTTILISTEFRDELKILKDGLTYEDFFKKLIKENKYFKSMINEIVEDKI